LSKIELQPENSNRRNKHSSVDTAEDVGGMDATVELTWMYLQRAEEVSAHSGRLLASCHHDICASLHGTSRRL